MDRDATYLMLGKKYTYNELCAALEAEGAGLPAEQWVDRRFKVDAYIFEAVQSHVITVVSADADDEGE